MCVHIKVPQDMFDTFRVHMENQKMLEATASGEIKPVIDGIGHHMQMIWSMWRYRS